MSEICRQLQRLRTPPSLDFSKPHLSIDDASDGDDDGGEDDDDDGGDDDDAECGDVDSDADDDGGGDDDHGAHAQYAVLLKTPVARSRPSTNWILLWRHS